jgi:hypothetical protein
MSSEVDLCNLALARLGDDASVSSINPPDQSAQASHCARFYPIARDSMLEMHTWGFSTKRAVLSQIANPTTEWAYCYAAPSDMLNILAVLDSASTDDYGVSSISPQTVIGTINTGNSVYTPQTFSMETINGVDVILTNQPNATVRYTGYVTDTTKFSPLFADALSWLLASHLAGPVIKGTVGASAAKECYQMFRVLFIEATISDANQTRHTVQQSVSWMTNR